MLSGRQPILSRNNLEELLSVLTNTVQVIAETMHTDDSLPKQ
jgi:hypothetical protein